MFSLNDMSEDYNVFLFWFWLFVMFLWQQVDEEGFSSRVPARLLGPLIALQSPQALLTSRFYSISEPSRDVLWILSYFSYTWRAFHLPKCIRLLRNFYMHFLPQEIIPLTQPWCLFVTSSSPVLHFCQNAILREADPADPLATASIPCCRLSHCLLGSYKIFLTYNLIHSLLILFPLCLAAPEGRAIKVVLWSLPSGPYSHAHCRACNKLVTVQEVLQRPCLLVWKKKKSSDTSLITVVICNPTRRTVLWFLWVRWVPLSRHALPSWLCSQKILWEQGNGNSQEKPHGFQYALKAIFPS